MAKIEQGILGGYSGRVGKVVGYYRMGKWCVRSYQPTINDAKTEAQLRQRSVFKVMIGLASRVLEPIRLGLKRASDEAEMTECNLFMHHNKKCFRHIDGTVAIDYAGLQLSRGSLPGVRFTELRMGDGMRVEAVYETNRRSSQARMDDRVVVYAYHPASGTGILSAPAERRSRGLAFVLPDQWAGQEVHFYGFTVSEEGRASATTYLGTSFAPMSEPVEDETSTDTKKNSNNNEERQTDTVSRSDWGGGANGFTSRGKP